MIDSVASRRPAGMEPHHVGHHALPVPGLVLDGLSIPQLIDSINSGLCEQLLVGLTH